MSEVVMFVVGMMGCGVDVEGMQDVLARLVFARSSPGIPRALASLVRAPFAERKGRGFPSAWE